MKNTRRSETKYPLSISIVLGASLALLATLLFALVVGVFINYEYLCIEGNQIVVSIIQIVSAFAGAKVAATLTASRRLISSMIVGIAYYITLLLSAMLLMDGLGEGIIMGAVCTAAGVIGAILLENFRKERPKSGKRRRSTR